MKNMTLLTKLKHSLPKSSWPWVFAALRQDPLIWNNIDLGLSAFLPDGRIISPEDVAPAAIALSIMQYPLLPEELRALPLMLAPEPPQDYDEMDEHATLLAQAGASALRLRDRRRIEGSWETINRDLSSSSPSVLACLFGMIPDPLDFLRHILGYERDRPSRNQAIHLALHAVLSNPLKPSAHIELLSALLPDLPVDKRLVLINQLSVYRPDLAKPLTQGLKDLPTNDRRISRPDHPLLAQIESGLRAAEIQRFSSDPDHSIPVIEQTVQFTRLLQAKLTAQLAKLVSATGDTQAALETWERACELDPDTPEYLAGLALTLLEAGRSADAQAHLGTYQPGVKSVSFHLAHARLSYLRGDLPGSREAALRALELTIPETEISSAFYPEGPEMLASLSELFLVSDLIPEAVKAAERAAKLSPNNPQALARLAHSQLANGNVQSALQSFSLATAQAPENLNLQRNLTEVLEIAGEWRVALQERVSLIDHYENPSPEDLRLLAHAAIQAGEPDKAAQICMELLKMDESDGLAYTLMGEAKAALGDIQSAQEYLQTATETSPQLEQPWLALARFYGKSGQTTKVFEILRTATLAAPDQPEIQLVLGETYLEQASPSQALTAFRGAMELISNPPNQVASIQASYQTRRLRTRIAYRLGQTLRQVGHLDEARQILEAAYHSASYDLELAHEYALVLLDLDEVRQALSPLQFVLENDPTDVEPYLDYASALLELVQHGTPGIQVRQAVSAIRRALELSPDHLVATGLLAEALAASGDYLAAMGAFQNALESSLSKDPAWQARLSLGLGQVALALGQIETSLVALQEANQADPLNPQVQRTLSQAYCAAGLIEDALQAARAAQVLAPTDIQNLTWFANQILSLQEQPGFTSQEAQMEAIHALEQAARLAPQRTDIMVLLGYHQFKAGDEAAARETLHRLVDIEDPETDSLVTDLFKAAQALLDLQDPDGAVICLKRALESDPETHSPSDPSLLSLLTALAAAHYQAGDLQASLRALDQALQLDPNNAALYMDKSSLLLEMAEVSKTTQTDEDLKKALHCARSALELEPDNPDILRQVAILHRGAGDLASALAFAEQLIALSAESIPPTIHARTLTADIARALLKSEHARKVLAYQAPEIDPIDQVKENDWIEFYCLRADLALEVGDEPTAINSLEKVLEFAPSSAHVQAIQSRLSHRHGDPETAFSLLQSANESLEKAEPIQVAALASIAEANLELDQWDAAIRLWEKVTSLAEHEPFSHLSLARALVKRAEFQRLCQATDVIRRAPGEASLAEAVYAAFTTAIQQSRALVSTLAIAKEESAMQSIDRWSARGLAVFRDDLDSVQTLAKLPAQIDDVAAQVALLHRLQDDTAAGLTARIYPNSPLVLIHLAAALDKDKPRQALAAAHAAAEILSNPDTENWPAIRYPLNLLNPLAHYLLARLYHLSGNRSGDHSQALDEILAALSLWPDEPRWHTLAADIYLSQNRLEPGIALENAVSHLEQAIELEPEYALTYINLGRIYLEQGSNRQAIQVLEPASQLQDDLPDLWLLLAQAYCGVNELTQAADCAEKAVNLSPNQIQPLLLRGEIALQAGNPQAAQSRAQAALRINPDDPFALLLMARVLNALNRQEEALFMIDRALPLAVDPLPISLEKIRLLRQSRSKEQTLQAIRELSGEHPEEPAILALQAEICDQNGLIDEAIQAAQHALHAEGTSPSLEKPDQARLHHLLGRLFRQAGQLDQAVHHLVLALQFDSQLVEAYLELGIVYQERREHNSAIKTLRQAIKVAPKDYRAYHQLGVALKESKDYLGAESMLRKAAELAPQDPAIHRLLAAVVALNLVHNRKEVTRDVPIQM